MVGDRFRHGRVVSDGNARSGNVKNSKGGEGGTICSPYIRALRSYNNNHIVISTKSRVPKREAQN